MLQTYLVNILIFCAILLLLALTVGAVQMVIILLDIRRMANAVKEKVMAAVSILDLFSVVFSGLGEVKNRFGVNLAPGSSTFAAFAAGLKKALQVLFKK